MNKCTISIVVIVLILLVLIIHLVSLDKHCVTTIATCVAAIATCVAAIAAAVSVYWARKAYYKQSEALKSQQKATTKTLESQISTAKRASFDTTFTQIFAQHSILYKKAQDSLTGYCCFAGFRTHFRIQVILANIKGTKTTNKEIWEKYNKSLEQQSGKKERTSNFRNYFKYIYIEVHYIEEEAEKAGLDKSTQKRYVRLIEGQMNNDELFCYLVNQLEYYENHQGNKKLIRYFRYLKDNNFFREICKESSGYQQDVIVALELFQQEIGESPLVNDVYELLTRKNWFFSN